MATLADYIEEYLQSLFEEQETVELQRRMLANRFQCVPSQINYVLSTRFTLAKGYVVETRRGEGGYIRIQKLPSLKDVKNEVVEEIGDALSSKEAFELLHFLVEKGLLTQREEHFLRIILQEAGRGLKVEDNVRANIIRSLFLTFL